MRLHFVGADDPVRPNDKRCIFGWADAPKALVPLRFTALVVGPYMLNFVGGGVPDAPRIDRYVT